MPTESGDNKLPGPFRKLIDLVSADPDYNAANSKLAKTALDILHTQGQTAFTSVSTATRHAAYGVV